jgi:hypothetical protein
MGLKKELHLDEATSLYLELKSSEKVAEKLCEKYNFKYSASEGRKIRNWLQKDDDVVSDIFLDAQKRKAPFGRKFYFITAAQNATPINKKVWESIKNYKHFLDATLIVIPLRYKNPTSLWNANNEKSEWWDENTLPYLIANRQHIHRNLEIIGDVKISPTASEPLNGFEGLSGVESSILGHPRQHFKPLPILEGQPHKFLITTGVVTKPNYTDSKVGKKSEFHHTNGFVIVEELNENQFTFRQVSIDIDGSFYDLDYFVNVDGVNRVEDAVDCVVLGDLHIGETCEKSLRVSYEMLERFNPSNVICHDIMEGYSVNPHDNPFVLAEKESKNRLSIKDEIEDVKKFIHSILKYNPIIVKSNHDDFIDRYLLNDWRRVSSKAEVLKYAALKAQGLIDNGVLPYEINQTFGDKVICLKEDDSFKINGVELGQHGHKGVSGSRGGVTQFKKLNFKIVVGHSHTPMKEDGCTYVGTLTKLRMGYNKGLSNWVNSNVIIHKNGKNQNILIFDGRYSNL